MKRSRPLVLITLVVVALLAIAGGLMYADRGSADSSEVDAAALKNGQWAAGSRKQGWWFSKPGACTQCAELRCSNYLGEHPVLTNCNDAACREAVDCAMERGCFHNIMELPQCYCGPVSVDTCIEAGHEPKGSCRAVMERGLDTTVKMQVLERWIDAAYPAGRANQLLTCVAELCPGECLSKP
jgi:hypothetical protein